MLFCHVTSRSPANPGPSSPGRFSFFFMGTLEVFYTSRFFARDLPVWGLVGICISFFWLRGYQIFEMKFGSDVFSYFTLMSSGRSLWELFPTAPSQRYGEWLHDMTSIQFVQISTGWKPTFQWCHLKSLWSTEYYGAMTYQSTSVMGIVYKIQLTSASPSLPIEFLPPRKLWHLIQQLGAACQVEASGHSTDAVWCASPASETCWICMAIFSRGAPCTALVTLVYTTQNKHGTWKCTLGKGDSYWKPSFPGSMLVFEGVILMRPAFKCDISVWCGAFYKLVSVRNCILIGIIDCDFSVMKLS